MKITMPGQPTGPGFKVADGYDIKKLDSELVKQAQGGDVWDENDQKRYDALVRAKTVKSNSNQNSIDQAVTGEADSAPSNSVIKGYYKPPSVAKGEATNIQEQKVNQDNDISTTITGDKNTVINEQDNSIRQYGGDNRSFIYNGGQGGNKYEHTPASMATLSGFYAPDDSPAANASFNDRYTTMNRDNQKRYAGEAMKTFAKYGNIDARSYTDQSMENALNRSTQYSFDRADRQTAQVFGDIWNKDYITADWVFPEAPKPIESNAADIAKDAKDDIEDL